MILCRVTVHGSIRLQIFISLSLNSTFGQSVLRNQYFGLGGPAIQNLRIYTGSSCIICCWSFYSVPEVIPWEQQHPIPPTDAFKLIEGFPQDKTEKGQRYGGFFGLDLYHRQCQPYAFDALLCYASSENRILFSWEDIHRSGLDRMLIAAELIPTSAAKSW